MNARYLFRRGNRYYFRFPIPRRFQHVYRKKEIVISLATDEYQVALERYLRELNVVRTQMRVLESGGRLSADTAYTGEVLRDGFDLRQIAASRITSDPIDAVFSLFAHNLERANAWPTVAQPHANVIAATVKTQLGWRELFERYKKLDRDSVSLKLDHRAKTKRLAPKQNALETFQSFFPEITDVLSVTAQHALEFKDRLYDLVEAGELQADTARRKIVHARTVLRMVLKADFPEAKNPFSDVSIKVHAVGKRKAFTAEDITRIIAYLDQSDASEELKALNFVAMNTGAHQKELVFLTKDDIHLYAPIPYIRIADNEFRDRVKSGGARHRDLPPVGTALGWMKRFPEGFPSYRKSGGADNLSAASNKHLKPLTGKTFYGYRHRIADVLRNSGCSDSLKDAIMGHTTPGIGSHYGEGYKLEKKREALMKALGVTE